MTSIQGSAIIGENIDYGNDIPLEIAQAAHRGTSFVPETRAMEERNEYSRTLNADHENLNSLADTQDKQQMLSVEFQRYRAGYLKRYLVVLLSKSRCVSTMIAGPANFNTRRYQKRGDVADKRVSELIEFRRRALAAIRKALCPEESPIMSGDADACERIKAKIVESEARRDAMKAGNDLARSGGLPIPHEQFEFANLGANIRRMKERLTRLSISKNMPERTSDGQAARLEDSPADNRIRLFFTGKPDVCIRTRLKSACFRWTPSLGCWQAYRNHNTLDVAEKISAGEK